MGHGGHWACFGDDVENIVDELVNIALEKGEIMHSQPVLVKNADTGEEQEQILSAVTHPKGDLRVMALVVSDEAKQESGLVAAYPFSVTGMPVDVTIQDVRVWEDQTQAQIAGTTPGGAVITFFDTMFFKNSTEYKNGETYTFIISALAYFMEQAKDQSITISDENLLRNLRGTANTGEQADPLEIPLSGSALIFPHSQGDVDDFNYHVPVEAMSTMDFANQAVYRIETTLLRTEVPLKAVIYTPEFVTKDDYAPALGQDVSGALWLQGFLAPK